MSRELKVCMYVMLGVLAAEILAELYFAARETSLTADIAAYLRSNVGRFDQFYAARNRPGNAGGGTATPQEQRISSDADVDNRNGGSGENRA